jgi:hemolysin activation/secretion protein
MNGRACQREFSSRRRVGMATQRVLLLHASLILLLMGPLGWAQTPPSLPADPSNIYRLRPPDLPVPPPARFDLRIETPEKSPIPRAIDELRFDLKRIVIEGATHYPAQEIEPLFVHLVSRRVGLSEIREAAERLEQRYREDGFFLVRVLIPAQRIVDGTISIAVIEGRISASFAQGGSAGARTRIERLTEGLTRERPLALSSLESTILRINDLPGIGGQAVLRPGTEAGTSDLIFSLAEAQPPSLSVSINNSSSNPLGQYGLGVNGSYPNPFGQIGVLDLGLNISADAEKLRALNGRYARPAGDSGGIFSIGALLANARPAGSLRALGIVSDSRSLTPRFRLPIIRSRGLSVYGEAGLAFNDSLTTLQDLQISHDRYSAADWALIISDAERWSGSTQIRLGQSTGLEWPGFAAPQGSQPSVVGAEPRFRKHTLTVTRTQNFSPQYSLSLTLRAQSTSDKLISGEKASFGGTALGRAYDGGAIAGDRGWGMLAELRWSVPTERTKAWVEGSAQIYGFADYARAIDLANPVSGQAHKQASLNSLGLGLRLSRPSGLQFDLQLAKAMIHVASSDPRPDPRLIFSLTQSL